MGINIVWRHVIERMGLTMYGLGINLSARTTHDSLTNVCSYSKVYFLKQHHLLQVVDISATFFNTFHLTEHDSVVVDRSSPPRTVYCLSSFKGSFAKGYRLRHSEKSFTYGTSSDYKYSVVPFFVTHSDTSILPTLLFSPPSLVVSWQLAGTDLYLTVINKQAHLNNLEYLDSLHMTPLFYVDHCISEHMQKHKSSISKIYEHDHSEMYLKYRNVNL